MKKILVIDDSHVEQVLLKGLLGKEYNVQLTGSGEEALDFLHRQFKSISAIILDIMLPGIDGYEVLSRLKSNALWRAIPVIVSTAIQDEAAQVRALTLGANTFVTKPFNQALLLQLLRNTIGLCETAALANAAMKDGLTGLLTRDAFFVEAERLIALHKPGHYMLSSFDIDNFKVINDQHGTDAGDEVLCHIADYLRACAEPVDGLVCHLTADRFAVLYPAYYASSEAVAQLHRDLLSPRCIDRKISIRIGRYLVENTSLSVSSMYDRAALAQDSIKGRNDVYIAQYEEAMRERLLAEQQIVTEMRGALKGGQFEAWYQPQYNHATGALVGAEALVRWRKPDGTTVSPGEFIPVFERNGFIYELDKYIWEQVCGHLRRWLDEGREPMPVSVNVSRHDVFHEDFLHFITGLVERYALPIELLRLEITESAFAESTEQIVSAVKQLIAAGFTVEIDDFGSGYSSLNTLKDVPAQILKLDMRFIGESENSQRGGNIVESVIRMARWLGMSLIAEGVERREQADYLRSIGCGVIQGYFYARPMPLADYEAVLETGHKDKGLSGLNIVENFDNSAFWTADSLDTLVFNHFSGGAFIFEYRRGRCEMLRVNSEFAEAVHSELTTEEILKLEPFSKFDGDTNQKAIAAIERAHASGKRESFEAYSTLLCPPGCGEYLRISIRRIAEAGGRLLFYGYLDNITAKREAEQRACASAVQIRTIMENIACGVTAVTMEQSGAHKFLLTNKRYYALVGYTKAQYEREVGTSGLELMHPDDAARYRETIVHLSEPGQSAELEFRAKHKSGRWIWLHANISVIRLADSDRPVQLASFSDVTSRKEAEEQELEANRQLRFLNTLSRRLLERPDAEAVILDSLRVVMEYFAGDRAYIIEYENGFANNTYEVCGADVAPQKALLQNIPLDSVPFWKTAFDGAAAVSFDIDSLPPDRRTERELLEQQGIRSLAGAPIYRDGIYSGFVGVDNPRRQRQLDTLGTLGDFAAMALTRRDLLRHIREESRTIAAVMDGVPGGFCRFRLGAGGRLTVNYYSCGYLSMLGMSHEQIAELTGGDVLAMVHPDDLPMIREAIAEAAEGREYRDLRYRLRADGGRSYLTVSAHAKADTDELGNIFINVYYSDATELIDVEARQTELLDNLPCGAALYDYDGGELKVRHLNRHYWEMVGRSGRAYGDISFIDAVHPDDRALIRQELAAAIRQNREFNANIRILYGRDEYRPFRVIGNVTQKRGGGYRIYAAYTPIGGGEMAVQSMLRLALDAMMDSSVDFTFIKDAQRRYVSVSNSVLRFLGLDSQEAVIGKSDAEVFGEAFAANYSGDDKRILELGEVVLDNEETVRGADGSLRFISTSKYPLRDAQGRIIGLYGISRNTTSLHTAQFELDALLHSIPSGVLKYSADEDAELAYVNRNLIESLGYTEQSFREKFHNRFHEMIYAADRARACEEIERLEGCGGIGRLDFRIEAADGGLRWFRDDGVRVRDDDGKEWYYVVLTDITNQKAAERLAHRSEEEFRLAVNDSGITICRYDIAGRTLTMSDNAMSRYGMAKRVSPFPDAVIANGGVTPESLEAFTAFFDSIRAGEPDGTALYQRRLNGEWRWLEAHFSSVFSDSGEPESAVVSFRDVTEQIRTERRADTDPLTGLLNRTAFADRLNTLLKSGGPGSMYALLMLDLDRFKHINDAYGHSAGDETLIRFGEVLSSCVRSEDMVCRLGGDEFFVCLCRFTSRADIENRVKRICEQVSGAFPSDMQVSASIGIAVGLADGSDFETLYHKADSALYHVKENGKDGYAFYHEAMGDKNGLRERRPESDG